MQYVLNAILIAEALVISCCVLLFIVANIYTQKARKMNPRLGSCSIDPLCHPDFAWDNSGNGWIGSHLVVRPYSTKQ